MGRPSSVTGWFKTLPFWDAPLERATPLPPPARRTLAVSPDHASVSPCHPDGQPPCPSRRRDHALASPGHLASLAASTRRAGATMHRDDAVLRRTSATLRRAGTILRPDAATFACFGPDLCSRPARPCALSPRWRAGQAPLSVAPTRLYACIVPLLRRISRSARPKGTGHAHQGCRWSRLSPGPNGGLT